MEGLTNELNEARNKEATYKKAIQALEETLSKTETQRLHQRTIEVSILHEQIIQWQQNGCNPRYKEPLGLTSLHNKSWGLFFSMVVATSMKENKGGESPPLVETPPGVLCLVLMPPA